MKHVIAMWWSLKEIFKWPNSKLHDVLYRRRLRKLEEVAQEDAEWDEFARAIREAEDFTTDVFHTGACKQSPGPCDGRYGCYVISTGRRLR